MNPSENTPLFGIESRRTFLKQTAVATTALAGARLISYGAVAAPAGATPAAGANSTAAPWYKRALRWGQTNIAEIDPTRYDIPWWREQWKRTRVQGVIINAGGIAAFYPTKIPFHKKAEFLGDRDLYGELSRAARDDGLAVFARMDSGGASQEFYNAHPDWFCVGANGQPYLLRDLYVSCVNGPYYAEHMLAIMREVIEGYHPDGFTDNNWNSLQRNSICYCVNCQQKFRAAYNSDLPAQRNWNDSVYRTWVQWNYAIRTAIWDENNRFTRATGGPDCLWVGMNSGTVSTQAQDFRDLREICQRCDIMMLDHQRRDDTAGFQDNGEAGKMIHGLMGWDKSIPESMAMYDAAALTFRLTSKPEPEARLWMLDGFAGGIQPWWHYVNAYHEDRRMYETPVSPCQWHEANQEFLINRLPVATVGVVWSQRNNDFFGREDADNAVTLPQRGITQALIRARIPYIMVHIDDLERDAPQLRTLILSNLGAMTDAQVASVRRFVEGGGGLFATGWSSLFTEWGDPRADFALADLFGASLPDNHGARNETTRGQWARAAVQSYLRLTPELRARVDGPHIASEPPVTAERHPVLRGFDKTDLLAFGGTLEPIRTDPSAQVPLTFIPPIANMPVEAAWMRVPKTDIAGLVLNEKSGAGRVAYLAADLDRHYARENLPDHANLLANITRWTAKDDVPLSVTGPGFLDCHLYHQPGRAILHLVNLTNAGTWRGPVDELIAVGPLRVSVKLPDGVSGRDLRLLVSGQKPALTTQNGLASFELNSVLDHEVVVIS